MAVVITVDNHPALRLAVDYYELAELYSMDDLLPQSSFPCYASHCECAVLIIRRFGNVMLWDHDHHRTQYITQVLQVCLTLTDLADRPIFTFYMSLFLFCTVILDVSRVRTFIMVGKSATSTFFFVSFLAQFFCRCLSLLSLNIPSSANSDRLSEGSGFFNQVLALWALPLMWQGRKGDVSIEDLPNLHPEMQSTDLYHRFHIAWKHETFVLKLSSPYPHFFHESHRDRSRHPLLVWALFKAFYPTFLGAVPPAIIKALAQTVTPLMVNSTINFINSYSKGFTNQPVEWGWALTGGFLIVFLGMAGANTLYFYYVAKSAAKIRGALIEAIFRKTLSLNIGHSSGGEDALNLMRYLFPSTIPSGGRS